MLIDNRKAFQIEADSRIIIYHTAFTKISAAFHEFLEIMHIKLAVEECKMLSELQKPEFTAESTEKSDEDVYSSAFFICPWGLIVLEKNVIYCDIFIYGNDTIADAVTVFGITAVIKALGLGQAQMLRGFVLIGNNFDLAYFKDAAKLSHCF
jgi:hypothetical protein